VRSQRTSCVITISLRTILQALILCEFLAVRLTAIKPTLNDSEAPHNVATDCLAAAESQTKPRAGLATR